MALLRHIAATTRHIHHIHGGCARCFGVLSRTLPAQYADIPEFNVVGDYDELEVGLPVAKEVVYPFTADDVDKRRHSEAGTVGQYAFGVAIEKGMRDYLEDAFAVAQISDFAYFGVYDGHGGRDVVDYLSHNLHKSFSLDQCRTPVNRSHAIRTGYLTTDLNILHQMEVNGWNGGSTAVSAFLSMIPQRRRMGEGNHFSSIHPPPLQSSIHESSLTNIGFYRSISTPLESFMGPNARQEGLTMTHLQPKLFRIDAMEGKIGQIMSIAHVGDSRAVLCTSTSAFHPAEEGGGGRRKLHALQLTRDHTPENPSEQRILQRLGAERDYLRVSRVGQSVSVSRAFGDMHVKRFVQAKPDLFERDLCVDDGKGLTEDQFLLLCTDGVWEVMNPEEACAIVVHHLQYEMSKRGLIVDEDVRLRPSGEEDMQEYSSYDEATEYAFDMWQERVAMAYERAAAGLRDAAVQKMGSKDNVTVMVIGLRDAHYLPVGVRKKMIDRYGETALVLRPPSTTALAPRHT